MLIYKRGEEGEFLMNWFCDTIHVLLKISDDRIQEGICA
jgi:hypothetical protein